MEDKQLEEKGDGMEDKKLDEKALTEEDLGTIQGAGSKAQQAALLDDKEKGVDYATSNLTAIKVAQDFFGGLKKEK